MELARSQGRGVVLAGACHVHTCCLHHPTAAANHSLRCPYILLLLLLLVSALRVASVSSRLTVWTPLTS